MNNDAYKSGELELLVDRYQVASDFDETTCMILRGYYDDDKDGTAEDRFQKDLLGIPFIAKVLRERDERLEKALELLRRIGQLGDFADYVAAVSAVPKFLKETEDD